MTTKKITVLAMLSALAFIMAAFARVPIVLFLRYDPKDVIITIGGFIYGPMAALLITIIVSTVQMFTVSQTGIWGLLMNIIGSGAFCCTAAYIYKKNRTLKGAVYGLIAAFIAATTVMMLWNYLIAPIYMGIPRSQVAGLLIPAFLPFNLIKNGLNAAFTILLYKHVKATLLAAGMLPQSPSVDVEDTDKPAKINLGAVIASFFVVLTCVLWVLVLRGIL